MNAFGHFVERWATMNYLPFDINAQLVQERYAGRILKSDDEQRRKWSKHLYGIDTSSASLYDLVLHIKTLTPNDAVDIICYTVGLPFFQTTAQSQKALEDYLLASEVKAALVDIIPHIDVSARDGVVLVNTRTHVTQEEHLVHRIKEIGERIPGVKRINVNVHPKQNLR
ncbi:hypothetical protein ACFLW8_02345 [Chloroflexota bacterium]